MKKSILGAILFISLSVTANKAYDKFYVLHEGDKVFTKDGHGNTTSQQGTVVRVNADGTVLVKLTMHVDFTFLGTKLGTGYDQDVEASISRSKLVKE